jgi:DNA primase
MKIGTITEDLIERINEEIKIPDIAAEYGVTFNSNNKARCPFHDDGKTGNLHYFSKNNTYFCFAKKCSAGKKWKNKESKTPHVLTLPNGVQIEDGGPSVIGFVMNMEQCSFQQACAILLERLGIPVPKAKVNQKEEREKKRLTKRNVDFCKALFRNEKMLAYLKERGIHRESIKSWRLGYVPKTFEHEIFGKKIADSLVFGISEDAWNPKKARTIAMAYRNMLPDEERKELGIPKYINDVQSCVYNKSTVLYGFNEARKSIRQMGYAIVTEGYVDVIIAHQSGLTNTVATCGTSFTKEQMEKLRRITKNLVFWYDGDAAGYDAMLSNLDELFEMGFHVQIVVTKQYDPAEIMNQLGQDRISILHFIKEHAQPAVHALSNHVFDTYEAKLLELQREALGQVMDLYHAMTDETDRAIFKSAIQRRLGVTI